MRTLILLGVLVCSGTLLATALPNVNFFSSPLHQAVKAGKSVEVRRLLDGGADPDAADKTGQTPLHYAVQGQRRLIVALLLEAGADVSKTDINGRTALDYALDEMLLIVDEVLAKQAPEQHNRLKLNAEDLPSVVIVKDLLSKGAKSSRIQPENDWILSANGRTAFPYVLNQANVNSGQENCSADVGKVVIGKSGTLRRSLTEALVEAVVEGNTRKVAQLLDEGGADVNDASSGCPLAFLAARNEHTDILQLLARRGAALDHFCELVDTDYFDRSAPGTLNLGLYYMAAPLMVSINQQHVAGVDVLLKSGADINQTCQKTQFYAERTTNPPGMSAMNEEALAREMTLVYKVQNWTPLMEAAESGKIRLVQMLLRAGADKSLRTNTGKSAYDVAADNGFTDIAELLKI